MRFADEFSGPQIYSICSSVISGLARRLAAVNDLLDAFGIRATEMVMSLLRARFWLLIAIRKSEIMSVRSAGWKVPFGHPHRVQNRLKVLHETVI